MKYVPKAITRAVGTTIMKTQKNSPTLLFVAGVVGFGTTVALACKATMKVEDVLVEHEKNLLNISRSETALSQRSTSEWEHERRMELVRTATKLSKLYAPTIVCGVISVACLTKSHRILTERNATLTAAYVGLQRFLDEYRGRVREEIGEEREKNVYYAATPVEIAEDGPNGPVKTFGTAPGMRSPYSALFKENNGNWQEDHRFNMNFLRIQEQLLTDKLRSQGSLMLNEVYDRLDMPRTATGALCGWMIGHPESDDFVEFDIIPLHDYHGTLMVDFNVAGPVYEMLSGRSSGRKERSNDMAIARSITKRR